MKYVGQKVKILTDLLSFWLNFIFLLFIVNLMLFLVKGASVQSKIGLGSLVP